ncbi:hypothetical protein LCGC14_0993310 [marine sediment metagenome]|uniref:Leucine-rich repeat domain-containing protein n=1 Tax=marine sediment metagenome TaxID=412755 RepID=A0A0F9RBK1_9ZZZZ
MYENTLECKNCYSADVLQTNEGYICRNCGISWKGDMKLNKLAKPREFKINDYLSLKLEDNITNIYIKGRLFQQCKYLLLNIPVDEIISLDAIESIDEAAEKLDSSLEGSSSHLVIPPETEFWGHCSNLQVWYENYYDTRLLHRDLAFPLLKKLMEAGDVIAKKVFKEEIFKRYVEGNRTVQTYLTEEAFLTYFGKEELKLLIIELFERENCTGLDLITLKTIHSIRYRNDEVIDLIFDSNHEFKNFVDDFLKEKPNGGIIIHRILLSLFNTNLNETDEFIKNLYKRGFKKCFLQADKRSKIELAYNALLQLFDAKEKDYIFSFIDSQKIFELRKDDDLTSFMNFEYSPENAFLRLGCFAHYDSGKARKTLREKIKKYFEDDNEVMIRHIIKCKYLQYLEPYELELLLEKFDYSIIIDLEGKEALTDEAYDQLETLAKFGYSQANQVLKKEFLKRFEEDQLKGVEFLRRYLNHLRRTEIHDFLKYLDYTPFLKQNYSHTFNILSALEEFGIPKARRIYKQLYGSRSLVKLFSSMETSKQEIDNEKKLNLIRAILPPLEYTFLQELQSLIDEKIQVYIDPTIMNSPSIVIEQKKISQIRLESQNLKVLPKSVEYLKFLKLINLNYNQLKVLPKEIGKITSLEEILLIENSITELPKTIGNLNNLRKLDLTRNKLDSLPRSIAKLKKLKYLNLNFNAFRNMPKIIGKLDSLKYLFYDYNRLQNLPSIFHRLKKLKRIDLQGNRLTTIPVALLKLNNIKKISLSKECLDRETINLLKPIKKVYSKFMEESDRGHSIWSVLMEEPRVEPLNILFNKYSLRFFFDWGRSSDLFWSDNDEALKKYGYPARLYNLPLSSEIIDKFISLHKKWYHFHEKSNEHRSKKEDELREFRNETKKTFLMALKQLGPNFYVKFQMERYGLPYER